MRKRGFAQRRKVYTKAQRKTQVQLCAFVNFVPLRETKSCATVLSRNCSSSVAKYESSSVSHCDRSITVRRECNNNASCSDVAGRPGTALPDRDASSNRRTCDQTCGNTTTRQAWYSRI